MVTAQGAAGELDSAADEWAVRWAGPLLLADDDPDAEVVGVADVLDDLGVADVLDDVGEAGCWVALVEADCWGLFEEAAAEPAGLGEGLGHVGDVTCGA